LNHSIFFPNLSRRNPTKIRGPAVSLGPAVLPLLEQSDWVIGLSNKLSFQAAAIAVEKLRQHMNEAR
jgi:hypothetical protein